MHKFLNVTIFSGATSELEYLIEEQIVNNRKSYICFLGAHGVVESERNRLVKKALQEAAMVVPDGMSIVWVGKLLGYKETERVYGPDTMLALCRLSQKKEYKIFLYGATEETLKKLKAKLLLLYPKLRIVGSFAPPFRLLTQDEKKDIYAQINTSKAQIVFVGLSTPKQELWMNESVSKLHANALLGVGAAFDFIAGTKLQAPMWMRGMGIEWLFRLVHEPRRLWYRYTVMNIQFLWVMAKHGMKI